MARTEEVRLQRAIERMLAQAEGHPIAVTTMRREPSPFATLFPAEVVCVSLAGGDERSFFVKHLGPEQTDHPEKQCRDREIRIYEELFGDGDLPVVRYYGSRWNESTRRREVFLEYVDDWNLRYQDLECWFIAASCLARFHAHFAQRAATLLACGFLLRLDAGYLCEWTERALRVMHDYSTELAVALAPVVREYRPVLEVLSGQPVTLVHNDLSPKNVLADRRRRPVRICFVDWETAGVGCGLMDVVTLKYGLDPADDERMRAAYCSEVAGTGLLPSEPRELRRLMAACELHRTIHRLAHSRSWNLPLERVAQWVADAGQLLACI